MPRTLRKYLNMETKSSDMTHMCLGRSYTSEHQITSSVQTAYTHVGITSLLDIDRRFNRTNKKGTQRYRVQGRTSELLEELRKGVVGVRRIAQ